MTPPTPGPLFICEDTNNGTRKITKGTQKRLSKEKIQSDTTEGTCSNDAVRTNGKARKRRRVASPINEDDPEFVNAAKELHEINNSLLEKQMNCNLSTINVKSIIHKVISSKLTQKMVLNKIRHVKFRDQQRAKLGVSADEELDDDDYLPYEPKLTRSKAKELWTTNNTNQESSGTDVEFSKSNATKCLWPISPAKLQLKPLDILKKTGNQTEEESFDAEDDINLNLLMHKDLPPELDDSEDDEYIPSRFDASNLVSNRL
jgi:hypothetical protein